MIAAVALNHADEIAKDACLVFRCCTDFKVVSEPLHHPYHHCACSYIQDQVTVSVSLTVVHRSLQASELAELAQELLQLGLPAPHIGETFKFVDAPAALRRFQSGKTVGKVVLEVTEDLQRCFYNT